MAMKGTRMVRAPVCSVYIHTSTFWDLHLLTIETTTSEGIVCEELSLHSKLSWKDWIAVEVEEELREVGLG